MIKIIEKDMFLFVLAYNNHIYISPWHNHNAPLSDSWFCLTIISISNRSEGGCWWPWEHGKMDHYPRNGGSEICMATIFACVKDNIILLDIARKHWHLATTQRWVLLQHCYQIPAWCWEALLCNDIHVFVWSTGRCCTLLWTNKVQCSPKVSWHPERCK